MTERLEWHRGVRGEIAPGRFDEHEAHEAVFAAGIEPIRLFQIRLLPILAASECRVERWKRPRSCCGSVVIGANRIWFTSRVRNERSYRISTSARKQRMELV